MVLFDPLKLLVQKRLNGSHRSLADYMSMTRATDLVSDDLDFPTMIPSEVQGSSYSTCKCEADALVKVLMRLAVHPSSDEWLMVPWRMLRNEFMGMSLPDRYSWNKKCTAPDPIELPGVHVSTMMIGGSSLVRRLYSLPLVGSMRFRWEYSYYLEAIHYLLELGYIKVVRVEDDDYIFPTQNLFDRGRPTSVFEEAS